MRKEQLIQQIIQQLQQLPEGKLEEVNQFIASLLAQGNKSEPNPYPLPAEGENRNQVQEPADVYKTNINNINSRLQALAEQLKNSTDQLLLKSVQRFLHIIEMKQIRKKLQGKAAQQGYNSEDDILASFS